MNKKVFNVMVVLAILLTIIVAVKADSFNASDTTVPSIIINSPASNALLNSSTVLFSVILNGTGTNISQAIFSINGSMISNYTYGSTNTSNCTYIGFNELFNCTFTHSESDGLFNLTITAYDFGNATGGNFSTTSELFSVDTTAPTLGIGLPTNNSIINTFTISVSANDSNLNYTLINVAYLNGINVSATTYNTNGTYNVTLSIPEGVYNITATAFDFTGKNTTVNKYNITYDQLPTGSFTSLTQNGNLYVAGATTTYSVTGIANDTFSGVKNVVIWVNIAINGTATYNSTSGVWNYTLNNLVPGSYNITANISDNNSNSILRTGYLVVDNSSPTFSGVIPANATYSNTTGSMLNINFTPSDNSGGISSCWYTLSGPVIANNVAVGCSNGALSSKQLYLLNGAYNLLLYANDSFYNTGLYNASFNVSDTAAPSITSTTTLTQSGSGSLALSVTTDENATCKYDLNNDANYTALTYAFTDNLLTHTATYTASSNSYLFNIRCKDINGNINTVSTNITVTYTYNAPPSGGDTGGGSGGGGGPPNTPNTPTDPSQQFSYDVIAAGSKVIAISTSGVPVSEIFMSTTAAATNVQFIVTATTSPSNTVSGTVYKYIQVDHAAIDNSIISDARIKFSIPKSWLISNNIDKNNVALLRYTTKWDTLDTTLTNEDAANVYYLADSPGLSLFAISVKGLTNSTNATTDTSTATTTNNTNTTTVPSNISVSLKIGDVVNQTIGGVTYVLKIINFSIDGSNVTVSVNNVTGSVPKGQSIIINGLNVYAQSLSSQDNGTSGTATLQLSKSTSKTSGSGNYLWIWITLVVIAVVGIAAFFISKNKEKSQGGQLPPIHAP